ncbi:hypothetical protein BDP27DRAFT_1344042 [Rhodocollybia butyracea]|uniref:Uncharacterized protein n=1 Tax=Rhodocollybia butyracea TaxID=206335 RepID=A0A9P5P858_9AGAR|nr:hypothetical protein BDP27DRAFT_1344042 [Rhodocollybia butyracea]
MLSYMVSCCQTWLFCVSFHKSLLTFHCPFHLPVTLICPCSLHYTTQCLHLSASPSLLHTFYPYLLACFYHLCTAQSIIFCRVLFDYCSTVLK